MNKILKQRKQLETRVLDLVYEAKKLMHLNPTEGYKVLMCADELYQIYHGKVNDSINKVKWMYFNLFPQIPQQIGR